MERNKNEENLGFEELVLQTLNYKYNAGFIKSKVAQNDTTIDLYDEKKKYYVKIKNNSIDIDRGKVADNYINIAKILAGRSVKKPITLIIVFGYTLTDNHRIFFKERLTNNNSYRFEIIDINELLNIAVKANILKKNYIQSFEEYTNSSSRVPSFEEFIEERKKKRITEDDENNKFKETFEDIDSRTQKEKELLQKKLERILKLKNENSKVRKYFAVGHFWGKQNKLEDFIKENYWESGHDEKLTSIVNNVEKGDILFLKSSFVKESSGSLRIKAIGYVIDNPKDGHKLLVKWHLLRKYIDLPDLGAYRNTISTISDKNAKRIIIGILNILPDFIDILISLGGSNIPPKPPETDDQQQDDNYKQNPSTIATVIEDGVKGTDYLGIDKDVTAFAKVIASASFKPPLAIALFGHWGMGKSFFMNKLADKIDYFSTNETDKENPTYINGIAQIHFNAWSYLDDNLWAGLINSIFEKLNEYLTETTKSGVAKLKVREKLIEKLISFKSALISLTEKKSGLELIQDAYKNEKTQLEKNIQYSFTNQILDSIGDNNELKDLHEKLTNYDSSFIEIISIKDSKIVQEFTFWNNFLTNLKRIKDFRKYLIYGILIVAILFGINYFIFLLDIDLMVIVTPIVLAFSKLGFDLKTVWKKYTNIKSYVKKLNTFIETNKEKKDEISRIEKSINIAKNQIIEADVQIEELKTKIESYEYKLKHDLTEDAISNFITDRATHEDYKNQLGIISVIRKDFETLSELFVENKANNTINNEVELEEQEKFSDRQIIKDQFKEGKKLQRIVLYIDDLDRCPEDKVIEVLEAVNLIMAFPLFVVVVGVDPRWVKNALIKKYHLQFGEDEKLDYKQIDASDYLEKIFQVPFHLKQAEDDGVKNMIDKLVKVEEDKTISEPIDINSDEFKEKDFSNLHPDDTEVILTDTKGEVITDSNGEVLTASQQKEEHLALTKQELDLMKDMSGIIGNNPRAIKRFVNVYNIVRAHAGLGLIRENKKEDYLTLMFLLALPIGPYKELHEDFVSDINKIYHSKEEENLSKYFSGPFNNENEHKENKRTLLGNYIDKMELRSIFKKISLFHLKEQNVFIQRFTFTDIID